MRMWAFFTVGDLIAWLMTRAAGYPFHLWVAALLSAVLAALFFGPARGGWGFRVTRAQWSQAGAFAALVYLFACSVAHHEAILRAKAFADQNHIEITRIGALPIPPSWLDWGDAIRSPEGIFESQFDLRAAGPAVFNYIPDSPPNEYIARAFELPNVRLYWTFARFPSIHSFIDDGHPVVELGENRFQDGRRRGPQPFTYRVVFDHAGNVLEQGWLTNGMLQSRMRRMVPQQPAPGIPAKKTPVKVLIFSDIHGDLRALARIVAQPADVYICAGDLATFRQRTGPLRRSAQAAWRAAMGAAGKSRNARRHSRILPALRLRGFSPPRAAGEVHSLGGPWLQQHHSVQDARRIFRGRDRGGARAVRWNRRASSCGSFSAIRDAARRIRSREACGQLGAARMGRARAAALSFLRTHPRDRRALRSAWCDASASTSAKRVTPSKCSGGAIYA